MRRRFGSPTEVGLKLLVRLFKSCPDDSSAYQMTGFKQILSCASCCAGTHIHRHAHTVAPTHTQWPKQRCRSRSYKSLTSPGILFWGGEFSILVFFVQPKKAGFVCRLPSNKLLEIFNISFKQDKIQQLNKQSDLLRLVTSL